MARKQEELSDSEVVSKGACPRPECGSSDAYTTYSDGHAHCFSCGTHFPKAEGTPVVPSVPRQAEGLIHPRIEAIPVRRIDEPAARKFGYGVTDYKGERAHVAPYTDRDGRVVAQKVRRGGKKFEWVGEPKLVHGLFGQSRWKSGGRMVVVTEGEIDAISAAQAMGLTWPVVSLTNGAQSAVKAIRQSADWLETFERVIFMFDMDDAGQEAAIEAAGVLSPGKVFIAELPLKDANDMVKAGRSAEIVQAAWNAKQHRPDGILTVDDLIKGALEPPTYGLPYPWRTLTEQTYGIRRGELVGFGAGVGSGKTTLFKQMMLAAMDPRYNEDHEGLVRSDIEPRRIGALMLEENPKKTLRALAGMAIGKRIHVPGVDFDTEEVRAAMVAMKPYFYAYNHFGAKDWDSIKERIRYMVLGLGIKDIFLDHLTALIANAEDDRKELDVIMSDLASMVEQHDFTLYFISHLTTAKGTPHEEGGRVHESQFTGSRAIARWAHNLFGLERNKQEPDSPTTFRILKERETGDATGFTFGLGYNRSDGLLREVPLPDPQGNPHGFKNEETNHDV